VTFVDMEITRRQFAARYGVVGRALLGQLADMFGVDIDIAEGWADAIDRETDMQIAAARLPVSGGGKEGAASATPAVPSILSHPVGSRRGSGAAASPSSAAAPASTPSEQAE
jgi:hypothetical protein